MESRRRPGATLTIAWLHLATLSAFGIALPLLQLYDESPEFLIARGNAWPDLPVFTVILLVLPPTLPVAVEWAVGRVGHPGLARRLHLVFVALFVAVLSVQLLKEQFDPARRSLTLAALVIGAVFALLYARGPFLPTVLTVLSPAALIVAVWFLGFSSAAEFAWPKATPDTDAGRSARGAPAMVVIFDELSLPSLTRDGHIDAQRFPGFAELARSSTWYPNASTVVDNTVRAVPAIMSGRLAARKAAPIADNYPDSIFRRLHGRYALHVQEPLTNLCDVCGSSRPGWWSRLRKLVDSSKTIVRQRIEPGQAPDFLGLPSETIEGRPEHFRAWVDGIQGGATLNLAHVELPHSPYQYDAQGRRYTRAVGLPGLAGEQWADDRKLVAEGQRRYLEQLHFVDSLLADAIHTLKRRGLWSPSLVVVTADHGVAFVPGHSRRSVEPDNVGEVGAVPLFVKGPAQSSGRVSRLPARTVDILPTIGDYLGLRWPGQSLRKPFRRDDVRVEGQFTATLRLPLRVFEASRDAAARRIAKADG